MSSRSSHRLGTASTHRAAGFWVLAVGGGTALAALVAAAPFLFLLGAPGGVGPLLAERAVQFGSAVLMALLVGQVVVACLWLFPGTPRPGRYGGLAAATGLVVAAGWLVLDGG
ncbi:hypothetical protein C1701_10550 [Actinoalloteichus sp. AHMU CJ021]|uniref:Uncharacterized protein n=1 Tax=Actinoalloteichus caeruleus DSM 43889 TaxID=1120930 RepID=A0ABT1JK48_ACTCY|nr:hypothetical protein [Actinoalloteichus caeruleus]AUS78733.1 hypothetical protein C1701_10550 [Actinoalloteichus sp. AHMU CJ021]MCP2332888.1 hypothetical protein [Actinoalloteichus caeruleus DSM 43889]